MALIDKASLLMVPSTYEAGKLYNVLPSGNRAPDSTNQNSGYDQTRADFTFDRGSNASATRIGSDGLIKKYRENKLLQSNAFSTSPWNTNLVTATSGQSGYDGNTNAWKIDLTGATGNLAVGGLSVGNVGTYSVYAKAGTLNWIVLGSQSGNIQAYINLSDGSIGTTGALVIEAKTEDVGGGWYRCSMTYSGTATVARVYPAQANGDLTATSGNILIQNAQVESGLVATDYLDSTSVTGKAGVLVDLPRINYDANGQNGSLLLEPSRQNLVTQSEVFDIDTAFIPSGRPSVEKNVIISPEGLQNATRLIYGVGNSLRNGPEFTFANAYTYSIFVKKDVGRYVTIYAAFFTTSATIGFDLDEGTCQAGGVIEPYGNDWYRISVSKSVSGDADKSGYFYLYSTDALGSTISKNGNKLYVWGNQIEEGNYVSSYIPTMGTSETRAADSITADGTGLTSTTKGSIFVDFNRGATSATTRDASNDGLYFRSDNFPGTDSFEIATDTDGSVRFSKRVNSSFFGFYTDNSTDRYKCVFKWNAGAVKFYVNGTQEYTSGSGFNITNVLDEIGYSPDFKKSVTQIALFNEEITDAEAITLTTL